MDRRHTLDHIMRLALAERSADPQTKAALREMRGELQESIGGTVRPAEAARYLQVSRAALQKWLEKGEIATVRTPKGRREIPVSELVALQVEVEDARGAGWDRALSAAIKSRRNEAASAIDIDHILPTRRRRTHREPEQQALAYHRVVAERLTPEVIDEARARIKRWSSQGRLNSRWAEEWTTLLDEPIPAIARAISSSSAHARQLRQTSPFAGFLTEQERKRLIDAVQHHR